MIKLKDSLNTRLTDSFFEPVVYICINKKHLVFGIRGPAQIEELPFKYYNEKDLNADMVKIEAKIDKEKGAIKGFSNS